MTQFNLMVSIFLIVTVVVSGVANANSSSLRDINKLVVYAYVDGVFLLKSPVL